VAIPHLQHSLFKLQPPHPQHLILFNTPFNIFPCVVYCLFGLSPNQNVSTQTRDFVCWVYGHRLRSVLPLGIQGCHVVTRVCSEERLLSAGHNTSSLIYP
jgi:hypothetical protein